MFVCILSVSQTTSSLACKYIHHFLNFHKKDGLSSDEVVNVVVSVIYLACKVEENFRSIRDIVNVVVCLFFSEFKVEELDKVRRFFCISFCSYSCIEIC
jgi:hypothetical protein